MKFLKVALTILALNFISQMTMANEVNESLTTSLEMTLHTQCKGSSCITRQCKDPQLSSCTKANTLTQVKCKTSELVSSPQFTEKGLAQIRLCKDFKPVLNELQRGFKRVEDFYAPIFKQSGKPLIFRGNSGNAAYARTLEKAHFIRYDSMTINLNFFSKVHKSTHEDIATSIGCHEVGHFLGGKPSWFDAEDMVYYAAEGQAEYFAETQCLPKLWSPAENEKFILSKAHDPQVLKLCSQYSEQSLTHLCIRLLSTSINKLTTNSPVATRISTPTLEIVEKTLSEVGEYPSPQCRLDQSVMIATHLDSLDQDLRLPCWFKK